jgi:anti-sigma factor RsiW
MKGLLNQCGQYREDISLLVAGALGDSESGEVMAHMAGCVGCRKYYDEMRAVIAPLANWEKEFAQIEPEQAVQRRWAKAIQAAVDPERNHASAANTFQKWWGEWILPHRHAWGGMAVVWLVMLGMNFGLAGGAKTETVAHAAPTAAMMEAMKEQRQLLVELIPPANIEPIEPPRRNLQPRSERQTDWRTC